MQKFSLTMGIVLLVLNSGILLSCLVGINSRLKTLKSVKTRKDLDLNYMLLFVMFIFLFANLLSSYIGYKYYIKDGLWISYDVLTARLIDRASMFGVSILLIFTGKSISKNIIQ